MAQVEVQGLDALMKKLNALGGNVDSAITRGLMRGGKMVQASAKALCAVNTGQLRNSIEVTKEKETAVAVGTNVGHAIFNEFGTGPKGDPEVPHTTKEHWSYQDASGVWHTSHGMAPRPFLAPSLHSNEENISQGLKQELQKEVRKVGGGK